MDNDKSVLITSLAHDGRGIGHVEGKTIFVEGALVGETVAIEYIKKRSRWNEARTIAVLNPVDHREQPKCAHFTVCGGCSLQHMDGEAQLQHKQAVLIEQLQHIGRVVPKEILSPVKGPSYGYRRKARLGVRYVIKKEKLLIGFRERNGRYLADIEACPVLHPSIGAQIPLFRQFLLGLESFLTIPQLEIAVGDHETAIIIRHLAPLSPQDIKLIKTFAKEQRFQIYLQPGGPETAHLLYPSDEEPRLRYRLDAYDIELLFHPNDFTQVNADINKQMIALAIELLAPNQNDVVLDLFCGIGNFTLPLSRFCKEVVGIEGSEVMVARAYANARHNGIDNVSFHCQNLADPNYNDNWRPDLTKILLDPPRAGAGEIIQNIAGTTAKRIVYVSCNPATLARDAGHLVSKGFELSAVGVLDMFPHTSHVESIAVFNKL